MSITRLIRGLKYQNNWMSVYEDEVKFADGKLGIYGVVEKPDFSLIVPYQEGHVYLVKQYRYPVGGEFWEFPQGSYETDPKIDPKTVAKGELLEEAGLKALAWQEIGYLYEAYGYSNQGFHVYLAEDLTVGRQDLEASELGMKVGHFSLDEVHDLIAKGEMRDAPSVSGFYLLLRHLETKSK